MEIFLKEKIDNPELFTGRKKELSNLLKWVDSIKLGMSNSSAILSRRKTGKTALLQRLYNIVFNNKENIVPFYFEVREYKQYLIDFSAEYFLTFIYQYIGFKAQKKEYLSFLTPSFDDALSIARKENLDYLDKLIKSVRELNDKDDGARMWDTVRNAPYRIASYTNEKIVQIIDEFQFLNRNIYRDKAMTLIINDMASSYFHTIEYKNAPFLLSGSWVGWLMDDIRTMLPARVRVQTLQGLPQTEAHEMTLKHSLMSNVPVTEETAWLIARICEGNPFYISCLFSSDFEEKDLATKEGALATLEYETCHGFIKGAWMEYIYSALQDVNSSNAKNIVMYLSKNREREISRKEIRKGLNLELSEIDLERRLKALIKSDIIQQGRSNYYYRGIQDNIFDKVFKGVYADDIAKFDPKEITNEYKELFAKLSKEYKRMQGEYNFFKGRFAEFLIINHLKYRAWKQNDTFCAMMQNLPDDFKFMEYETVWSYHGSPVHKKNIEIDIFARASSGYSLIGEVKNRDSTRFSKAEAQEFLKKANTMIELETIRQSALFVFSSGGFSKDAIIFMEEHNIAWTSDSAWLN